MSFSRLPPVIRTNVQLIQIAMQAETIPGAIVISSSEVRYSPVVAPRRSHESEIHDRLSLLLSDLRREALDITPLAPPPGYNWENQVASVCNEINQFDNNTKNDERLLQYYQLGQLLSQRGFSKIARGCARTYLLPNRQPNFWLLSRRIYLLYSTRGTWNISGTMNLTCYVIRYISENDFYNVLIREATNARTNEMLNLTSTSWVFAGAQT
jgi:hypothetical protein